MSLIGILDDDVEFRQEDMVRAIASLHFSSYGAGQSLSACVLTPQFADLVRRVGIPE